MSQEKAPFQAQKQASRQLVSEGTKSMMPPSTQLKASAAKNPIQKQSARPDEIAYAILNPVDALVVKSAADKAFAYARASGLPGARDGQQDAYRHCVWNALASQAIGAASTSGFTTLHEQGMNPANDPQDPSYDPIAISMDLHNNRVGRQIGTGNLFKSEDEIAALCMQALANGDLKMIKTDAAGNYLDAAGNVTRDRTAFVLVASNHPTMRAGDPVYRNNHAY